MSCRKKLGRKGSAAVWLLFMILLIVFIVVYEVFSYPVAMIDTAMRGYINDTVAADNSTVAAQALSTIDIVQNVWQYWPIFLFFGLAIWVMMSMQKKEPLYE